MPATSPAIGISIGFDQRRAGTFLLRQDYVRSVDRAGGMPLVLAPVGADRVGDMLDRVRALVLTGGSDVDPGFYGATPHPRLGRVFPERDAFEIALTREALRRDLPILGICRGHQVLNVATGGTLIQDIPSEVVGAADHDPERERWETAHDVRILPGTRLRDILKRDKVAVNSFHHQAVDEVGQGLAVSAWSQGDRVIEGIEMPGRFVVGVQWHPEGFWNQSEGFQPLFDAVVAAAR
jgi:putative glutamine amidotransferase